MTVDKKQLFKTAWGLAKNAAWSFGGKPVEYFAECLKKAWSFVKPVVKKKKKKIAVTTKVNAIKDWFVSKSFEGECFMIYMNREEITTLQESEKAVFVKISTFYGESFKTWVPKSCIAA